MKNNKPQFSKCWLVCCAVISLIFTTISYVLSAVDKNPVSELSIALLDTLWGTSGVSFIGYVIQNCVRAFTASKFGIPDEKGENQNGNKTDKYGTSDNCSDDNSSCGLGYPVDTFCFEPEEESNRMAQVRRVGSGKGIR